MSMTDKERVNKFLELIDILINNTIYNSNDNKNKMDKKIDSFINNVVSINSILFETDNKPYDIFIKKIDTNILGEFIIFFSELSKMHCIENTNIINLLKEINSKLIYYKDILIKKIKNINIFYSWQSDLTPKYNRSFIKNSIKNAIKEIKDIYTDINIILDESTKNVSGSPDIVNTILYKIKNSDIFICDVSSITKKCGKEIPNPNVVFELGYAMHCLGDSKIIMIFNETTGNIRNLPFDLGFKRQLTYKYGKNSDKYKEKNKIENKIKEAIKMIIVP